MGNMAYPVVTRLGLNQFWYSHWYSDTTYNYTLQYKQSVTFKYLFRMYLNYGLTFSNSLFFHEIFLSKPFKQIRHRVSITNHLKHFRRFFFTHERLGIEHSYYLRYKTGEYFPIRLWIMSWSQWFIISFNCFKPIKKKSNKLVRQPKDRFSIAAAKAYNYKSLQLKRFKLLFLFVKRCLAINTLNYFF